MGKFKEIFLRSAFNYDTDQASQEAATVIEGESMAQQQFKEECDINTIVERFGLTGDLPENLRLPVSGDFTGVVDFKTAMDAVSQAQSAFNELPAQLRARFENDPQRLMRFLENDKNREEAVELGLVMRPPEVTRDVVQAVDELKAVLAPVEAKK